MGAVYVGRCSHGQLIPVLPPESSNRIRPDDMSLSEKHMLFVVHFIHAQNACKGFSRRQVTCSALCDEATWLKATLCKGLLHYLQRHSVLDAAPRVQHLRLCQDLQHSPET